MNSKLRIGNYTEQENLTFEEHNLTYYCLCSDYSLECIIVVCDYGIRTEMIKDNKKQILFKINQVFDHPKIKCIYKGEFPSFDLDEWLDQTDAELFKQWMKKRNLIIKEDK